MLKRRLSWQCQFFSFFTLVLYGGSTAAEFVNSPMGPEFNTIQEVFAAENKKVCLYDSLYGVIERYYPTNVDDFNKSSVDDTTRLLALLKR